MKTEDLFNNYIAPTYGRFPVAMSKGKGSYLYDEAGEEYLDFVSGIAVNTLGHAHPALIKTISKQASQLLHCSNLYWIESQGLLAQKISDQIMRSPGRTFFCNSGAEANEVLIKLSRRFAVQKNIKNPKIITFNKSFHGRTMAGISATGQAKTKKDFDPLLPGFIHVDFNNFEALEQAVNDSQGSAVAVMLEIVQGEGGINIATADFLKAINSLCKEQDLLLLIDEVQAGIGRTGSWNAWESIVSNEEFQPDGVSWAKGLGGGVPIGAAWMSAKKITGSDKSVFELLDAGSHGCTFGGNPMSCSVALRVLEEIENGALLQNVSARSQQLLTGIEKISSPLVKRVKGVGLMLGIELDLEQVKKMDGFDAKVTPAVNIVKRLFADRMLVVAAGESVVRLLPALNVSEKDCELAISKLSQVFS